MSASPNVGSLHFPTVDLIDEDLALEVYESAAEEARAELNDVALEAVQLAKERIAYLSAGAESVPASESEDLLHSTKSIVGCLALKRCWTCLDNLESNWKNYPVTRRREALTTTELALREGILVLVARYPFLIAMRRAIQPSS